MPAEVIDFLAGRLQIADPSCVKRYAQRQQTHREHAAKIRQTLGLKDFAEVEVELAVFAGRRAWVTGDGPKAIFADAVGWLRDRDVLLPGVSRLARLARLVARERDAATQRLWETLHAALTGQQRLALDVGRISQPCTDARDRCRRGDQPPARSRRGSGDTYGNDPAGRESSAQPVHDIEHLTKALGIVEESGRLADRFLLVDDPNGGPK